MQVTLETTSGLERRMRISVPAEQLDNKIEVKLKQTAGQVKLKGFRPGKVPMREVKRRFGKGIRQEVSSEVIQSSFAEAIRNQSVSPAGIPQIENVTMEAGKDLEFTAVFEVLPEINLSNFETINVERPLAEVTPTDIDNMIETLRRQRSEFKEVERNSKQGDKVNLDYEGFIDGESFEGSKAEGSDITLGSGRMIPGFEDCIIGCGKSEEKEFSLTFPDNYQSEKLAGKAAVFKIRINTVSESVLPELDDEFFANFGVEEGGFEAFRVEVTSNMQKELEAAVKNKIKNEVLDGLLTNNRIELPRALIEQEIDRLRHDAIHQLGGHEQIDPSLLPAEMFTTQAEKRVSLSLLVSAIIDQNELKVDDEKVKIMIENMAGSYEEPEQVVKFYYANEEQLSRIQNVVLEDQVIDVILDKAVITDVRQSYDEAIKPAATNVDQAAEEDTADAAEPAEDKAGETAT